MASLKAVVEQLKETKEAQDETTGQVIGLNARIDQLVESMNLQRLDMLEAMRESKKVTQPSAAASGAPQSKDSGGLGFSLLGLGALGALGATLAAVAASVTGLDDFFKGLRVVQVLKRLGTVVGDVVSAIGRIGNAIVDAVKALGTVPGKIVDAFKAIPNGITNFFGDLSTKIFTTIPDDIAKISAKVSDFFKPVGEFFAKVGDVIRPIVSGIGTGVSLAGDAVKATAGFFTKIYDVLSPVLSPLKKIVGLALRPFFQLMISAIDFVVGFYDGFTETAGGLRDKLIGGIGGGVKGIVKGIADAINLVFVDLPEWIAGQLGFDNIAASLSKIDLGAMVEPAFDQIFKFFREGFSMDLLIPPMLKDKVAKIPTDFFARTLAAALPPPDFFQFTTPQISIPGIGSVGGGTYDINPFPASLYQFAGIDYATGEKVQRPSDPAVQNAQAVESMTAAGSSQQGRPMMIDGSTNTTQNIGQSSTTLSAPPPASGQKDDYSGALNSRTTLASWQ